MSQQNVEIAERAMDAFNRRDVDAFVQPATTDFEWFPALGAAVEGGSFVGREGVETYFEVLRATWEEVRLVTEEVRDFGETIVWRISIAVRPSRPRGCRSKTLLPAPEHVTARLRSEGSNLDLRDQNPASYR